MTNKVQTASGREPQHYSVKTICQLTGLNEHTLRAWERRYQVVHPDRLPNGRRVYTVEDLEKLKLVTLLVRKGFLIGNIAQNSLKELNALVNQSSALPASGDHELARVEEMLRLLRRHVDNYDFLKVHVLIQQARIEYGIRDFILSVAAPLTRQLREPGEGRPIGDGQFQALSALIRAELMQNLYLLNQSHAMIRQLDSTKTFALATSPNSRCEFNALMAAVLCAFHGYSTYYFGPQLSASAFAEAASAVNANCLILNHPGTDEADLRHYLRDLRSLMPAVAELWLDSEEEIATHFTDSVTVLPSIEDLDQLLTTIKKI